MGSESAMTGAELDVCLAAMGWSRRQLAAHLGVNHMVVQRWLGMTTDYTTPIPPEVAVWLRARARDCTKRPFPRGAWPKRRCA